ncbi:MAG: flagellar hook-basal body complex protein [Proteobacteria bacterium]|nr:flagellar hook-basal body complex protein [Pseudomonadota bacterium]MBU1639947.1 flagellar hook-basal body complex protein [Pseudomonadota bacterium]
MAISSSLYSSISGLSTMGNAMSVLGDNVANVNTVAYKSSRATFQDVLSQSVSTASGSRQVGRGVTLSTVDGLFAQGSFESSSTPTDMAIGGQGFFMLRGPDSAEADMYSRAGEFRFDQEGNLINPVGYFVQGWELDGEGDRAGTIGDINIGKSTPPVTTTNVELIANLDSRIVDETNEERLFESWNGTNAALATPTPPIDSSKFEYTSAIKVYDSQGASHDITIYFDKTTNNNEWEFMVTCDPTEDLRNLSVNQQQIFAPYDTMDYTVHQGAGALMYGTIQFTTSGEIDTIDAWQVPPDGQVDPARNENRIVLNPDDAYYEFSANFTGEAIDYTANPPVINPTMRLNIGAQYGGVTSTQSQILVSDGGAISDTSAGTVITSTTQWNSVYDSSGNQMMTGDVLIFDGFDHTGASVTPLVYTVDGTNRVQDLLDDLRTTFGVNADLDDQGRLRLTDSTSGDSALAITEFYTISANNSVPFGGVQEVNATWAYSLDAVYSGGSPITDTTTALIGAEDAAALPIEAGDQFVFAGASGGGTFTEGVTGTTIQDLLTWLEGVYAGTTATLDSNGYIRIVDNTPGAGILDVTARIVESGVADGATPWGMTAVAVAMTPYAAYRASIDITTSKQQILSIGQGFATDSGTVPVITSQTPWASVHDLAGNGGAGTGTELVAGDTISFTGVSGDGATTVAPGVNGTFLVQAPGSTAFWSLNADPITGTVQDLLNWLEFTFEAEARIDEAGRLQLTDWVADSSTRASQLTITSIAYSSTVEPWGVAEFETHLADIGTEDGSQRGDVVSNKFKPEALATTQYANSSTTIFQDQDGFSSGFLQSVSVDTQGVITGHYSNGQVLEKAQVALATFNNLTGLFKNGGNIFTETTQSGAPTTGAPGDNGLGSIAPNALEQSNVDLGVEFVKLITVQRGFQANSKIITTTDEMLNDLINIKR